MPEALNPNEIEFTEDDLGEFMPPEGPFYKVKVRDVRFFKRADDASWKPNETEARVTYVFLAEQDDSVTVGGKSLSEYCAGQTIRENLICTGGGGNADAWKNRCRTLGIDPRKPADAERAHGMPLTITIKHKQGKPNEAGETRTFLNVGGVYNMQ